MNYPLISEYIEAIKNAEDNLKELSHLRPVLNEDGMPIMSSGNFAVVFKMTDGKKDYAIKCFTKEQKLRNRYYELITQYLKLNKSEYFVDFQYYDKELFVDNSQTKVTEFPILCMDWVEGLSLDQYVDRFLKNYDNVDLKNAQLHISLLIYNFYKFSKWIIEQPIAHGDLKPDNIIVSLDGRIHVIDYDGMFVPSLEGCEPIENGTPLYRNPRKSSFDRSIDDYAITTIMLSLQLSITKSDRGDYRRYKELQTDKSTINISKTTAIEIANNRITRYYYSLLMLQHSSDISLHETLYDINIIEPQWERENEFFDVSLDSLGAIYSKDFKTLFMVPELENIKKYTVHESCEIIDGNTFAGYVDPDPELGISFFSSTCIDEVILPPHLKRIGDYAFWGLTGVLRLELPDSIVKIGDSAFSHCYKLGKIVLPKNLYELGEEPFAASLKDITSNSLFIKVEDTKGEGKAIFSTSGVLLRVTTPTLAFNIPTTINTIGKYAFRACKKLNKSLTIPPNIQNVCNDAFWNSSISELIIKSKNCIFDESSLNIHHIWGRKYIEGSASIPRVLVPWGTKDFYANQKAFNNTQIVEANTESIITDEDKLLISNNEDYVTYSQDSTKLISYGDTYRSEFTIPEGVEILCDYSLNDIYCEIECFYLRKVILPSSLRNIGENVFCTVDEIISNSPNFITENGFLMSADRTVLYRYFGKKSIIIVPDTIKRIAGGAFSGLEIDEIHIPKSVRLIGDNPFVDVNLLNNKALIVRNESESFRMQDDMLIDVKSNNIVAYLGGETEIVIIPNGILTVGNHAFRNKQIEYLFLNDELQFIYDSAFYCACLKEIVCDPCFPKNIKDIVPSYLHKYLTEYTE